jgi:hypothetical protein
MCPSYDIGTRSGPNEWEWNVWTLPSRTEADCLGYGFGKEKCVAKTDYGYGNFWYNEEDCACYGGIYKKMWRYDVIYCLYYVFYIYVYLYISRITTLLVYVFEYLSLFLHSWTPGVWMEGDVRPLTWMKKEYVPKYEWKSAMSFIKLETWIREATAETYFKAIKSQISCEANIVTSSLNSLVCDCLAPDSPKSMISVVCFYTYMMYIVMYIVMCIVSVIWFYYFLSN